MITWKNITTHTYNRFSGKVEMCAILSTSGKLYPGVKVENASFPLTISQFQSAIFSCLSEGDKPKTLYMPADSEQSVPQIWIDTYDLKVEYIAEIPNQPLGTNLTELPQDVRKHLIDLQLYCQIAESNFPVSSLLEVEPGRFLHGVNIELTDWQLGLCAERTAIAKAISLGYRDFQSIHIFAPKGDFISPCGACRQVLVEHLPYKKIYLYHPDGTTSEHTAAELLPAFFNGNSIID